MNSEAGRELRHHGILGQKWGMRRFQNPDGSLTPAGRERYGYSSKKKDSETNSRVPKSGMPANLLTTLGIVGGVTLGNIVGNAVDNRIKQYKTNKSENLSNKEKKVLENVFANRRDLQEKYAEEAQAIAEFSKAREKIPELMEGTKEYNKYFNEALEDTKNYYKREFGISDNEAEEAALEDSQLQDEMFRRYYRESNHPAVKEFREKYDKYSGIHKELSDEARSAIRNALGKDIDPIKMEIAAYEVYKMWENNDSSIKSIPKTGMNLNSVSKRISNWYNGYTTGETDSTKVSDRILKQQMERNINRNTQLQKNWDFSGPSAREERNLSKKFVKTVVKEFDNGNKTLGDLWRNGDREAYYKAAAERRNKAKRAANEYIREVAKIRLKSMGYDITNKAIDNLISKDWFKNSLWIQNTLASLGADGVKHTPKDDIIFR